MRTISPKTVATFATITTLELGVAIWLSGALARWLASASYVGVLHVALAIILFYGLSIAVFRWIQAMWPLPTGDLPPGSTGEARAFLYQLHYLMVFNTLIFSRTLPVPLMRLILQSLGARFGHNSYSSGIVMDAQFVSVGDDTIIGNSAMIIPHVIEGERFAFMPVTIGHRVTIGARAVVMADVVIEDDATVAVQAVVRKGTRIGRGEIWAGSPAKCIRRPTTSDDMKQTPA